MPSVLLQYVIPGQGFFVKLAGGGGYHFGRLESTPSWSGITTVYRAEGLGLKAEAVGQTALTNDLFVYIGGSLRWELLGSVKDSNGRELSYAGNTATLSFFASGLALGVVYYF
jgi:hypothetical protein